jgi:gluconate 2-dehydrogenase gamma chain
MTQLSRRGFLATAGGTLAAAWLTADVTKLLASGRYAARAGEQHPPRAFEVLTADQAADLEAATAQIIPTDDTPGAREARVVYFIDHSLAGWQKGQRGDFEKGIAELRKRARRSSNAASFAALTDEQQRAVIASLEKDRHPFFFALRGATIVGFLSNPSYHGNNDKLGWKAIGFDDRFSWSAPFGWYDANER